MSGSAAHPQKPSRARNPSENMELKPLFTTEAMSLSNRTQRKAKPAVRRRRTRCPTKPPLSFRPTPSIINPGRIPSPNSDQVGSQDGGSISSGPNTPAGNSLEASPTTYPQDFERTSEMQAYELGPAFHRAGTTSTVGHVQDHRRYQHSMQANHSPHLTNIFADSMVDPHASSVNPQYYASQYCTPENATLTSSSYGVPFEAQSSHYGLPERSFPYAPLSHGEMPAVHVPDSGSLEATHSPYLFLDGLSRSVPTRPGTDRGTAGAPPTWASSLPYYRENIAPPIATMTMIKEEENQISNAVSQDQAVNR